MTTRRTLAVAVPAAIVVVALAAPTPSQAAAGSCQGQVATIEAAPGQSVVGTEGPDVIIGNVSGGGRVDALGGDDTICVVAGTVEAGAGNDSVQSTSPEFATTADLGPGDDHYFGGPSGDQVDMFAGESAGTDVIATGGGADQVGSGAPGEINNDTIDLGAGSDFLGANIVAGSAAHFVSGGGQYDALVVAYGDGDYVQDLGAATVSAGGVTIATIGDFDTTYPHAGDATHLSILGTPGNDSVWPVAVHLQVDLGAGSDFLELAYVSQARDGGGHITLGPGQDTLRALADKKLTADLAKGSLSLRSKKGAAAFSIESVENFGGVTSKAKVVGDDGPNQLYVYGCRVTLRGGDGHDRLVLSADSEDFLRCRSSKARFFGGPGPDRLEGRRFDDVLIGGPGRDVADGGGGHDVCVAERIKGNGC